MKKRFLSIALALCMLLTLIPIVPVTAAEGDIAINETNFPDAKFRDYVIKNFDTDKNNILTATEISKVKSIYVSNKNIKNLKGVELFANVKYLDCRSNELTTLDVSKNTELTILDCYNNRLTSLDVSQNIKLYYLDCYSNELTTLDVSKNTELTSLYCSSNELTTLDVSKNTELTSLDCCFNELTTLDVSKNTELTRLSCGNNQLTTLDVSKNTELTILDCYSNELTSLDVSQNIKLYYLDCSSNELTTLDVSKNTELTSLDCYSNELTTLDVSKNTELTRLSCWSNQLTTLDVSKNTELTGLFCDSNQFTTLDVSWNTELTSLYCRSNQLTTLDVSKNIKLYYLYCDSNKLTSLDVSKNTELTRLTCSDNICKIDLAGGVFNLSTLPGFNITKASNWQNATVNGNTLTVSDPTKIVQYTYETGNGSTITFKLQPASCTITADMVDEIADQEYTNTNIEPGITVRCGSYTLRSGTDYTVSYENNINQGVAAAIITGKGSFYKGNVRVNFNIVKAIPTLDEPTATGITYGEYLNEAGLTDGWSWADGNIKPTVANNGYVAYYTPADTNHYDWASVDGWNAAENRVERTVAVDVNKADQAAPCALAGTAETIDGKADGKLTGATTAMEYRKEGDAAYTEITATEVSGLAVGTYYIRYKANDNYNASSDSTIVINKGRKLTVTVPETQAGYTVSVNKTGLVWNDSTELTFALADGYSKLDTFAVKVNGNKIELGENGKYTIANAEEDVVITVEGVADITAPVGEISIGTDSWKQFLNNVTFGLCFKDTQEVTITATDSSGDDVEIKYLLSDKELTAEELATASFTAYNGKFTVAPNNEYVIYAELTDKTGNVTYINSNGIVLDDIPPVITGITNGETYCEAQTVTVTDKHIDTVTVNGSRVTLTDGKFTLYPAEGTQTVTATDKAGNVSAEIIVTVNDGHTYEWQSANGEYWQKCELCEHETTKKAIPAVTVNCPATVCRTQDFIFSTTLPAEIANVSCGYSFLNKGDRDIPMTDQNGVMTGKIESTVYEVLENSFEFMAVFTTTDGFDIVVTKNINIQNNHTGGKATCKDKAICDYCGEPYGEVDNSNHDLEHIGESAATVTETGNTEYWHCKDCDNNFSDKEGKTKIDLKDTVTPKLAPEIIDGEGQSLTAGEKKELTFRSNAAYSDFIRAEVDGKTVDRKNYTVKEGSTIVTLKADYVATLSAGKHTLGIVSESGTATTTFKVNAKVANNNTSPATGDNSNMALWFALFFVSGGLLTVTGVYDKKKKYVIK